MISHTLFPLVDEPSTPPSAWLQRPLLVSWGLVLLSALTVLLGACASPPMPTDQIAVTTAAIAHAEAAGGQALAPAEMGMARDKLRRANLAVAAQAPDEARRLAQQAQVDALLAEAKAESVRAKKAAAEVQAASQALREEMGRKAP
jgi:Domain of unknown function (DUF4398)